MKQFGNTDETEMIDNNENNVNTTSERHENTSEY